MLTVFPAFPVFPDFQVGRVSAFPVRVDLLAAAGRADHQDSLGGRGTEETQVSQGPLE